MRGTKFKIGKKVCSSQGEFIVKSFVFGDKSDDVEDTSPLIMVEPVYATGSTDIFLHFREPHTSITLSRFVAEQLAEALLKACRIYPAENQK